VATNLQVSFPKPTESLPVVAVEWEFKIQHEYNELAITEFTVRVEDRTNGKEKIVSHLPMDSLKHFCHVEFDTLYQFIENPLTVSVRATRADGTELTRVEITKERCGEKFIIVIPSKSTYWEYFSPIIVIN